MRRSGVLLVLLTLVIGACGGSAALEDDEQVLADAIADFISEEEALEDSPISESEVRCLAEDTVRTLGVDGLAEIGITPDSIPEENPFEGASDVHVDALVDAYFSCLDAPSAFAEALTAEGAVSEESAQCVGDTLDEDGLLRPLLRASLAGEDPEPEMFSELLRVMVECLTPEELAEMGGP
jgi:hypothetical protein